MLRYEILILVTPEITQDEAKFLESQLDATARGAQASVISFDRWGKYQLAYPVKKHEYGIYYLLRCETAQVGSLIEDLKTVFKVKLYEIVMRHIITLLGSKESLHYQRPPSLEDMPVREREIGSFLADGEGVSARRRKGRDRWEENELEQSGMSVDEFEESEMKERGRDAHD